ncbi:MAG: hypothetical protein JKY33_03035 [Bacteroidia bacterium]|nr:hypothetical protein [Bacteroidia bacterium]
MLLIITGGDAFAQPANDNCASAIDIPIKTSNPQNCINGTTVGATIEGGEPTTCNGGANQTVWYKFTATSDSAFVTILGSALDCFFGSEVWDGSVGCMPATSLGCEAAGGGPYSHGYDLTGLTSGTDYYIQVTYDQVVLVKPVLIFV